MSRLGIALLGLAFAASSSAFDLQLDGWRASIDPRTMAVGATIDGKSVRISAAAPESSVIADLETSPSHARWTVPASGLAVEFEVRGKRLHARFTAKADARISWPVSGDPAFAALLLPEGSGLYVPLADAAWRARLDDHCANLSGGLLMPFWSYELGERTLTFFVPSDLRSRLCLRARDGRLTAVLNHEFQKRDGNVPHEIEIGFGAGSPIAPALEYRERLRAAGGFPTLAEKIRVNANVAKLAGAVHMYTWGDGRKPDFIADLEKLGVKRAWIGYDQDPTGEHTTAGPEFVAAAKAAGYLVGPYDTFNNGQDPKTGDYLSRWPGTLYPDGCIVNRDGKQRTGFAGHGCELSSEAMRLAEPAMKPLAGRLDTMLRDGANSYFLDVDAFGEVHDDYSPAHPLTVFQDRQNRLARLRLVRERGIVLGSEEGVGWSVGLLDFAHGAGGTRNAALWAASKNKAFGAWWPADRPAFFFKTIVPSEEFRASRYDAAYRLPLYAAAFHDAVVVTDRWDVPINKFPSLAKTRLLQELLYGAPSMWSMDRQTLSEWRDSLAALQRFFEPLHGRIATLPLTSFEWLTNDRLVQRTRFGDVVELTANFGAIAAADVASGCLRARWLDSGRQETFCPVLPSAVAARAQAE
jgi:hypothetical protein